MSKTEPEIQKTGGEVAQYTGPILGFDQGDLYDTSDFTLPRLKLLQALSQEVVNGHAKAGEFADTVSGSNYGTTIQIAAVGVTRSRSYFVKKELLCASRDFHNGVGTPGGKCADCKLSKWTDAEGNPVPEGQSRKGQNDSPPKCAANYDFLGVPLGTGFEMPMLLQVAKASAKAGRALNSLLRMAKPMFAPIIELASVKRNGDEGDFYAISPPRTVGFTTPEQRAMLAEYAQQIAVAFQQGKIDTTRGAESDEHDEEDPSVGAEPSPSSGHSMSGFTE